MDIYLYSPIESGLDSKIKEQLKNAGGDPINVHINSPGGSVYTGISIHNLFRNYSGNVTGYIDGIAASISSYIPMAFDKVFISENAQMMIHNSRGEVRGTKEQIKAYLGSMDRIDEELAKAYNKRTGLAIEKVKELLSTDTFMDANEAVSFGFADEIVESKKIAAYFKNYYYNNMDVQKTLTDLKALGSNLFGKPEGETQAPEVEKKADELKAVTEKKVTDSEIERKDKLPEVEALTADMVPYAKYQEDMIYLQNFAKLTLEYIEAQPTKEEIEARINEEVGQRLQILLKQIKSQTEIPRPATNFEEVVDSKETRAKKDWDYVNEKLTEIEKANAK